MILLQEQLAVFGGKKKIMDDRYEAQQPQLPWGPNTTENVYWEYTYGIAKGHGVGFMSKAKKKK